MEAFVRALALVMAVMLLPSVAAAQGGPSFDCAKASNAVERAICKDAELAKADREMVAAVAALSGKIAAPAKDHLAKDQARWLVDRNGACAGDADGMADCLKVRYGTRTENLKAMALGAYPFVSEHAIHKNGKIGKTSYRIDIRYPQFDGTTADFGAVNRLYRDDAAHSVKESTPPADTPDEQKWSFEQGFLLFRPSPHAITVSLDYYGYTGGAHGNGGTVCTLTDLRSGKSVEPGGVFAAGDKWLDEMVRLVGADLKKQFETNPGFDDALQPAKLAELMRDGTRYCWRRGKLQIVFNAYEVGPYAAGAYQVDIVPAAYKPLLRAGGPID
jgi:uncharacterized protein